MARWWRRAAAAGVAAAVLVAPAAQAGIKRRAGQAVRYIVANQSKSGAVKTFSVEASTADAVLAFVAAGRGGDAMDKAIAFLKKKVKNGKVTGTGVTSKVIMAAHAAGKNPRRFGGTNLVKKLRALEQDGRFGDASWSYVYDQALALLALSAAGVDPSAEAVAYLVDAQCGDGGWQFDAPTGTGDDEHCHDGTEFDFSSDTNTTALAVMALSHFGVEATVVDDAFLFLADIQDDARGGWGYSNAYPDTDTNSTALVVQAYEAAGEDLPGGARDALKELQHPLCGGDGGAFALSWNGDALGDPNLGATVAAVPALLGVPFPVDPAQVKPGVPSKRKCR